MNYPKIIEHLYTKAKLNINYTILDKSDGNGPYIDKWEVEGVVKPTIEDLDNALSQVEAEVDAQERQRTKRKNDLKTKLNLSDQEVLDLRDLIISKE